MPDALSITGQGQAFADAAKRNALLSTSLIWTFGSKKRLAVFDVPGVFFA
jgi:hypothetical protein